MSLTFSRYVCVIFHVCPVLSFPYISRRADLFYFPFISRCFPDMWTSYFLPSFPCTSLHFPFAPQYFPQKHCFSSVFAKRTSKNTEFFQIVPCTSLHFPLAPQYFQQQHGFSSVFEKRTSKNTEFSRFSAKASRNQQKAGRGNRAWDPCFATPNYQTKGGGVRGGLGGVILYPLSVPNTPSNVGGLALNQRETISKRQPILNPTKPAKAATDSALNPHLDQPETNSSPSPTRKRR